MFINGVRTITRHAGPVRVSGGFVRALFAVRQGAPLAGEVELGPERY